MVKDNQRTQQLSAKVKRYLEDGQEDGQSKGGELGKLLR